MQKQLFSFIFGLILLASQAIAQQRTITGTVTDVEDGSPLPGVTVRIKGTQVVTVTSSAGKYAIKASEGQVLVFSFVGSAPQEATVSKASIISISLKLDATALTDVVITAYGISRDKRSLGYSAPTVKGDEVSETQRNDFFGGLQGRVPGLTINSTNGNPGASAQIVLRGFVSLSGDNNALIVMDGVPINNTTLNQTRELISGAANRDQDFSNRAIDINPNDIESYTVLKGPEATALYGSAGASGAILITTKKGKAGSASINYNNSFRVEHLNKFPAQQTVYNSGSVGVYNPVSTIFNGPVFLPGTKLYDNIDAFFQDGFTQKHNLSVDGGTEKFTYRWSNEYSDTKGTVPTTTYKRLSSRLTGTAVVSPLLKLTTTFNYINTTNDKVNKGANGFLLSLYRFNPSYDITQYQDINGNRLLHTSSIYGEFDNPLWEVNKNKNVDKTNRIFANGNIEFTPINWLKLNAILGADVAATSGLSAYHAQSYRGSGSAAAPTGGRVLTYDRLDRIFNGSFTASAKQQTGDFNATYVLGATFNDFNSSTNSAQGQNMYDPDFYSINNTLPTTQRVLNYINRYRTVGAFGQAVLGYKSLLYVTLSGRVDGASKLMSPTDYEGSRPFFAYPSASTAFNFTELTFFKEKAPWFNYGKLSVSYALTGKEPWREYSLGTNYAGAVTTGGGYALSYYAGNPNLKPETSKNFEVGIETQFFNNRLSVQFDYYNLRSVDQIINPRLSYGGGFILELINGGTVVNRGFESQVIGSVIKRPNLAWDVTANFSLNRGKVLSIADELPELYDSDTWILTGVRSAVHPGASTTAISGTRFERNSNGDLLLSPTTGLPTTTDALYYPIGDRTPKFNIGLTNRFRYKSLNLSFLWDLRYGGDVLNGTEYEAFARGASTKTLDRETPRIITGVLKDGLQNTDNPTRNTIAVTPYYSPQYYTTNISPEMFVERNIKALRLRDVTLGYDFPPATIAKIKYIKSLGVFVTVTDAVLLTNYTGSDPETNSNSTAIGGVGGFGIDYGNVGKPIGFNLGLRVRL
ncbi:MAG: SusC/RagA family TonB-linked outer membrane protein [Pedobacter sp.]